MLTESSVVSACIDQDIMTSHLVDDVRRRARREGKSLLSLLSISLRLPVSSFYRAYAAEHQLTFITGKQIQVDGKLLRKLPRSMVERCLIFPLMGNTSDDDSLEVVTGDAENQISMQQIERLLGVPVRWCIADPIELALTLKKNLSGGLAAAAPAEVFEPVATLSDIFNYAYLLRSSDIHIEPMKESIQVRLRVDGRLQDYPRDFMLEQGLGLMSRLKVLAGLDISEQRMPQDGSLSHAMEDGVEVDIRVATLPTRFGERATLRLLGSDTNALTLEQIGMSSADLKRFKSVITKPFGMILITGPTGSGKSTTLYSALQVLATDEVNVLTVEDPIEYVMDGVSQVHVSTKVSFAGALRSFLRHDPDVIMVGEIRDGETANIAMKASMTGHLVLSTLHTNTAPAAVTRLIDLGAEPYLIGATVLAVVSQRLVRRLCLRCKEGYVSSAVEQSQLGCDKPVTIYKPKGCASCMGIGYRGRVALFETLWVDEEMSALISQGANEMTLQASANNLFSLSADGIDKVLRGITSISELQGLSLLPSTASTSPIDRNHNDLNHKAINHTAKHRSPEQ